MKLGDAAKPHLVRLREWFLGEQGIQGLPRVRARNQKAALRGDLRTGKQEEPVIIALLQKGMMGRFEVAKGFEWRQVFALERKKLHRFPHVRFRSQFVLPRQHEADATEPRMLLDW